MTLDAGTLDRAAAPRRPAGARVTEATPRGSRPVAGSPVTDPTRYRHPGPDRVLAVVVVGTTTPAATTPAAGTPAAGTPAAGTPAVGPGPGAAALPDDETRTVAALVAQSRPPDAVVGVDATGTAERAAVLAAHLDQVCSTGPAGLGDAVRAGVALDDARALVPQPGAHRLDQDEPGQHEPDQHDAGQPPGHRTTTDDGASSVRQWLWLLVGGGVPAPDALERLLLAVEAGPSVAVAGCKHRDGARLVDAGLSLSRLGRPLTGVDHGDVDQGQLDRREDVLAVGVDGMLVRRDVWDALGGFDPGVRGHVADIDLCRRVWRSGRRVTVVSGATSSRAGAQPFGAPGRRDLVHLRLAGAPLPLLPLVLVAVLLGALARFVVRVAAKEPGRGVSELGAVLSVLSRPDLLWRSRRAAARTAVRPRRTLTPLLASRREVARWHRTRWHARRTGGSTSAAAPVRRPRRWRPALAVVAALTVLSAVALHRLVGPGEVTGAALAAAPDDLAGLWEAAGSSWVTTGLGTAGPPDPFLALLTLLSAVAGGSPALAVTALLVAAVPLAGWGAWLASGAGVVSVAVRAWASLAWAAAPALLVAVDLGRLGPLVVHVALPWLVWALSRVVTARASRAGWTASAAAGLALTVVVSAAPALLVPALVLLVAVGLTWPRSALPLVWTPLPAVAVLGPLLVAATRDPRLLVAGPGPATPSEPPAGWELLLGGVDGAARWPVPGALGGVDLAGALPLVASGVVLLVALVALARRGPAAAVVRLGWLAGVLGLGTAVLSVLTTTAPGVRGWAGAGVSLMTAGLLVAAVTGADGVRARMAPHAFGWRQGLAGLLAVVAVLGPLATASFWAVEEVTGGSVSSVARGVTPTLPSVAVDGALSLDRTRTLVMAPAQGGVSASLVRGDGPGLEDTAAAVTTRGVEGAGLAAVPVSPDAATSAVDAAVAALVAGSGDARPQLAELAAGYVLLLPGEGAETVATAVAGLPGLEPAGSVEGALLWRVDLSSGGGRDAPDRAARVRVVGPDGVTALPAGRVIAEATLEPGPPGRVLVLSERSDDGWWAELDGVRLEPVAHAGWAQGFVLPEAGGQLLVDHDAAGERAWPALAAALLVLTVLLAVPVPGMLRRLQGQSGRPTERAGGPATPAEPEQP